MINVYAIIAHNIIISGTNIEWWIVGAEVNVMLEGWCNVLHQSTENFIIGKLIRPTIATIDENLFATSYFVKNFQMLMYKI